MAGTHFTVAVDDAQARAMLARLGEPGTEDLMPRLGDYGNGALNLTDVERNNPIGSVHELCAFRFDGANKVGSPATAFGDIRYRSNATDLYQVYLTFEGKEYASGEGFDTSVSRDNNQVRFSDKALTATDGSNATLRVSGIIPMRPNRPLGC